MSDAPPGRELIREPISTGLSKDEHNALARVANTLAASGFFPDAQGGAEAYAKILLGRSIGLAPMQAMTGIHIVEGKPQIAATTLAGFVRASPTYDYQVLEHDDSHCAIRFVRLWPTVHPDGAEVLGESAFSIAEAEAAGLVKDKSAWKKYPRNMVFARAMSNGVRWFCPDLFGGVPVYTEADEFERGHSIAALDGDGAAQGIPLPPEVEAVIARATEVGHAALANRAAIELTLDGQDPEFVEGWVKRANEALGETPRAVAASKDAEVDEDVELDEPVDADVLPAEDDAAGWRRRSAERLEAAERLTAAGAPHLARLSKEEADTALQTALSIEEGGGVAVGDIRKAEGGEDA